MLSGTSAPSERCPGVQSSPSGCTAGPEPPDRGSRLAVLDGTLLCPGGKVTLWPHPEPQTRILGLPSPKSSRFSWKTLHLVPHLRCFSPLMRLNICWNGSGSVPRSKVRLMDSLGLWLSGSSLCVFSQYSTSCPRLNIVYESTKDHFASNCPESNPPQPPGGLHVVMVH